MMSRQNKPIASEKMYTNFGKARKLVCIYEKQQKNLYISSVIDIINKCAKNSCTPQTDNTADRRKKLGETKTDERQNRNSQIGRAHV